MGDDAIAIVLIVLGFMITFMLPMYALAAIFM
jgi:hypothetical protein